MTTSYTYDALNQLLSEATASGGVAYGYDLEGSRTSKVVTPSGGGGVETTGYEYDAHNRLVEVTVEDGGGAGLQLVFESGYDYRTRRLFKRSVGTGGPGGVLSTT